MVTMRAVERLIRQLLAPVYRRARLAVLKAVVERADDSGSLQRLQLSTLDGQVVDNATHFQPLGLASVPAAGAEALAVAVGGSVDHTVAVGVQDRGYRPTNLAEGETQVYDKTGSRVYLKADSSIVIVPGSAAVHIGADPAAAWIARADLVDARLDLIETWAAGVVAIYNAHNHLDGGGQECDQAKNSTGTAEDPIAALPPLASVAATKGKVT